MIVVTFSQERFEFRPEDWKIFFELPENDFGGVSEIPKAPALPDRPCPFVPEKRLTETHALIYVPRSFFGKSPTVSSLRDMVMGRFSGIFSEQPETPWYSEQSFASAPAKSGWKALFNGVVPDSENMTHKEQERNLKRGPYRTPESFAVVALIALQRIKTERGLRAGIPWGRVSENLGDGLRVRVGHLDERIRLSSRWAWKKYNDTGTFAEMTDFSDPYEPPFHGSWRKKRKIEKMGRTNHFPYEPWTPEKITNP